MGYIGGAGLGMSFAPFAVFQEIFGFVPNLFRAQSALPHAMEAEAELASSIVLRKGALSRVHKEFVLLASAAAQGNTYCTTLHHQSASLLGEPENRLDQIVSDYRQADLAPADRVLLDFTVKLGISGSSISSADVDETIASGWAPEAVFEAVAAAAWASFLCTLSIGLDVAPDFRPVVPPLREPVPPAAGSPPAIRAENGPYLRQVEGFPEDFPPLAILRRELGFIPNLFRAQALRPDLVEAEVEACRRLLFAEDVLTRIQRISIAFLVAAGKRDPYWAAIFGEDLGALGKTRNWLDHVAAGYTQAPLTELEKALSDFVWRVAVEPAGAGIEEPDGLRRQGFTEQHVLDAVVTASFSNFLITLQRGLGAQPDFPLRSALPPFSPNSAHLPVRGWRPTHQVVDPDAGLIAGVRAGNLDAFEALMNRHSRTVYRTLVGLLGDPEEARDATQDTFLRAFEHLDSFHGRAKFSTWLLSIATNAGLQSLRERRRLHSLDEEGFDSGDGFRPKELQAWTESPEQAYSKLELRTLVENSVMKLPLKYRVVLLLRDIEQLPAEEAAAVLGLGIPALKARLHRGRLMLREALSAHFAIGAKGGAA